MEKERRRALYADLSLFAVAVIWGGGFVAGKAALTGFSAMTVVALRFCGAAILSGLLFFRIIRKSEPRVIRHGLMLGIIQFAAQGIQLMGLNYTTAGKQAFLIAGYVVLVPFLLWIIMKKRPALSSFAAGLIALTGIGLLSLNESLTIGPGEILSLISTVAFALQLVLISLFAADDDPVQLTFFQFVSAGALAAFCALTTHQPLTGAGREAVIGVIYLIVLNTVVGFIAQNAAQRYTKASHASLILSMESVFGFLASALIYGEHLSPRTAAGSILILAAILVSKLENQSGKRERKMKKYDI